MKTSIPEPFQYYLLLCLGIGFLISLAATALAGCYVLAWLCNKVYIKGGHSYSFMIYLYGRQKGTIPKLTGKQIDKAITEGLLSFDHECDHFKVKVERKFDVSGKPALAQVVAEIRHRLTALQLES